MSAKTICYAVAILCCVMFPSGVRGENLTEAWSVATQESRQLAAQRAGTEAATAGWQAASSARLPKITHTTAYTALSEQPQYNLRTPELFGGLIPSFTYPMPLMDKDFVVSSTMVSMPLYMGGKIHSLMEQAEARVEAARSGEVTGVQQLKMNVAENYFLVLRLQGLVEVLADSEKAISAHARNVSKMLETGLVTRNAFLAAQVAHADIQQKLMQAQNTLQVAESAYNRYLWRPMDTPVELEAENIGASPGDLENYLQDAMAARSELRQMAAESQMLDAQAKEFRSARLPQVAATAGHTYIQNDYLAENNYWSGTVGVTWTPFDGGVSRSRERSAQMQASAVMQAREEVKSGIQLEVRKNWLEEQDARARVDVAKKAIEQAEENLRVVDRQFQEGLITHTEVLDAVALYTQARTNYCNAAYDAILAGYRLKRAAGRL